MFEFFNKKKAFECFEFGRIAYNQKDYLKVCKWMKQALNLVEKNDYDPRLVKEEDILDYYAFSAAQVRKALVSNSNTMKSGE